MALTYAPPYLQTQVLGAARLTAANTARDGSGTLATLFTGGTDGGKLFSVTFHNSQQTPAASSAMVGRLFFSKDGGVNIFAVPAGEIVIGAVTASNTAIGASQTITFTNGLDFTPSTIFYCIKSVHAGAQDQVDVIARGGNYS